jgi:hypothetical protein
MYRPPPLIDLETGKARESSHGHGQYIPMGAYEYREAEDNFQNGTGQRFVTKFHLDNKVTLRNKTAKDQERMFKGGAKIQEYTPRPPDKQSEVVFTVTKEGGVKRARNLIHSGFAVICHNESNQTHRRRVALDEADIFKGGRRIQEHTYRELPPGKDPFTVHFHVPGNDQQLANRKRHLGRFSLKDKPIEEESQPKGLPPLQSAELFRSIRKAPSLRPPAHPLDDQHALYAKIQQMRAARVQQSTDFMPNALAHQDKSELAEPWLANREFEIGIGLPEIQQFDVPIALMQPRWK